MKKKSDKFGFPMYFYFRNETREGKVLRTKELVKDFLLVDYDSKNRVVGIEILDCKKYTLSGPKIEEEFTKLEVLG